MATWYVDSAAVGTGAGTSWVNACTTFAAVLGKAVAAGDDFNVANTHSESTLGAVTLTFPGTAAAPNRVFSCDKNNAPAQAADLLAGAAVATTGGNGISIGGYVYIFGVTFTAADSTNLGFVSLCAAGAACYQVLDTCTLVIRGTAAGGVITVGGNTGASQATCVDFINTTVSFSATGQKMKPVSGVFRWFNTASAIQGAAIPGNLFSTTFITANVICDGVDLSGITSGNRLVFAGSNGAGFIQFLNCKVAAGVTVAGGYDAPADLWVDLVNSDSGATNYRQERYRYQGTLTTSTTVYNNATDGTTPISWQVATTANSNRQTPFECFMIVQWAAAGTYAASTIQCTSATAALTNADVWVDVEYLGSGLTPISSKVSSGPATQLTAGSPLAAGTWAHGGLGNNYQLAIPSFTTAQAGYVRCTVKVAKASLTVNVDPAVTIA